MTDQPSLEAVYAPWGGNGSAMARAIEELPVTVNQWRNRGSIPPKYWPKIIKKAAEIGHVLTLADFMSEVDSETGTPASSSKPDDFTAAQQSEAA